MTNLTPSLPISEANSAVLLQTLTAEKTRRSTENRLAYYSPYPKQLEFHAAGAPDSRIDALLLLFVDYASPAQAVGVYRHQSRRGCVFDRKDYCHVQFAVHCYVTQLENLGSLALGATTERYCPAETLGNYAIPPSVCFPCASHGQFLGSIK